MGLLFDADPIVRSKRVWHEDYDGNVVFESRQDVESVVDLAKAEYRSVDERARWGEMAKVASIPLVVFWELKRKGIVDDQQAFRKWLNDNDNQVFRTRYGKL